MTGIVTLLVGIGIGAAGGGAEVTELEDEIAALEEDLADAEEATEDADADAAEAQAALEPLERQVARVDERQAELDQRAGELNRRENELASQSSDLDDREAEVSQAEQTLESSTIPDGIWQLDRDYQAGTYRAPGGGGCYWALLGSADTQDIINNGGFGENQTITIDSPYFETKDCGEWILIE